MEEDFENRRERLAEYQRNKSQGSVHEPRHTSALEKQVSQAHSKSILEDESIKNAIEYDTM